MTLQETFKNKDMPKFLGFDEAEGRRYECKFCGDTVHVHKSVFYGRCRSCGATLIDYKPLPHQIEFHKSDTKYRLLMGGYGTGKTTMCVAEVARHAMTVAKGKTLITAPKLQLVKDAILPELDKFLPPWTLLVKRGGNTPYYQLTNGHEIVIYASNDEEKLRSLNLTMFYMEEASAIDVTIFHQLQARLRNNAGIYKDKYGSVTHDMNVGIISSNPEQGWLVTDFLLYAKRITSSESVDVTAYQRLKKDPVESYEAFLSSTRDNPYLPRGFIANLTAGKSHAWVRKYIDCALEIKQGAVYPEFSNHVVDDFPIPPSWKRVVGFDKGWRDETAMIMGAINPKDGVVFWYQEYYVANQPLSYHAMQAKELLYGLPMFALVQADPTVLNHSDHDGKSYQDYFYKVSGIHLEPANNSITIGIEKVRDYMYCGKMKFFTSLVNLKEEMYNYVYPDRFFTNEEKPAPGRDHLMDALRYATMCLPQNPFDMTKVKSAYLDERQFDYFWKKMDTEEDNQLGVYSLGGDVYDGERESNSRVIGC